MTAIPNGEREHVLRSPANTIALLEYGEYQCPYCGKAHLEVKRLLGTIGDQIRFSFRNFPLKEIHPQAMSAALAAEAAARQGKFWEMHDLILENQRDLRESALLLLADSLHLDLEQFRSDMKSPELTERVQEDFMSGVRT